MRLSDGYSGDGPSPDICGKLVEASVHALVGSTGAGRDGEGDGAGGGAGATLAPSEALSWFSETCAPSGPAAQVRNPSVKIVRLSALIQASRPPVVCCRASPFATEYWSSRQSPTTSSPISWRSSAKPKKN